MPEGPECTTVAVQLNSLLQNSWLSSLDILSGRYTKKLPDGFLELESMLPLKVIGVRNKGKFIYIELEKEQYIFVTLGMSGSFKVSEIKHSRVSFTYLIDKDNTQIENTIYYVDPRNFGTLKMVSGKESLLKKLKSIGPDMLNDPCSLSEWFSLAEKHKNKSLVNFLMTQSVISGVGNIYKSESLFLAKLFPGRRVKECTKEELIALYHSVIEVLKTSFFSGGSTISTYSDLYGSSGSYVKTPTEFTPLENLYSQRVMVYNQKQDPFGNPVERIILDDNRTTHYSPKLQK